MTTSSDLVERALAIEGAVNIAVTVGSSGEVIEYTCSIRRKGLATWEIAHGPTPIAAMEKAVQRLEDERDLI